MLTSTLSTPHVVRPGPLLLPHLFCRSLLQQVLQLFLHGLLLAAVSHAGDPREPVAAQAAAADALLA